MKENEIKINNYLNHSDFGIIKVEGIKPHCGDFEISVKDTWLYLKKCNPIPLTEELLLKCGFEYFQIDRYKFLKYKSDNLDFLFKDGKVKIGIQGVANIEWFMELEYLHNLQNFFALTNQELKINL